LIFADDKAKKPASKGTAVLGAEGLIEAFARSPDFTRWQIA